MSLTGATFRSAAHRKQVWYDAAAGREKQAAPGIFTAPMTALTPHEAAALFQRGIEQFNCGEFFESHESWELIWLPAAEPDKTFLQGIIQVAAALHHFHRGNLAGARSLLQRGLEKIEKFPAHYRGVDLEGLRAHALAWQEFLRHATGTPPSLPRIRPTIL